MKNMKIFVLLLCAVLPSVILNAAEGRVRVSAANVRLKPQTSAVIVARLKAGDKVEIVGGSSAWFEIKAPSVFVSKSLVDDGKIKGDGVRLRAAASVKSPIVGMVNTGTPVREIADKSNEEWLCIEAPEGVTAFVAASLIDGGDEFRSRKPAESKPEKKKAPSEDAEKVKGEARPFDDLAVEDGSARRASATGMLLPVENSDSKVAYVLATEGKTNYVPLYFVHTAGAGGARLRYFVNKRIRLEGISYKVPNWDVRVLKVSRIIAVD